MADWRQIQARIRKAKNSPEAPAKLSELYQRTRDAMVAWELGAVEEKAGRNDEAAKWYTIAAQRFRRSDWKKKAEEALTRLGVELPPALLPETGVPAQISFPSGERTDAEASTGSFAVSGPERVEAPQPLALGEIPDSDANAGDASESTAQAGGPSGAGQGNRKRRRGRRGGRGRRRKGAGAAPGLPAQAFAERAEPQPSRPEPPAAPAFERRPSDVVPRAPERRPAPIELPTPQLPSERAAHGRGDPALASRMAYLESLLRRLVGSPLHRLADVDEAPAGPGVFLLSDSDQITSYYIEACQTLRIGIGNLVRGGGRGKGGARAARGRVDQENLKAKLAEHLGISEAKVSQYMKDHCVVRWIQLDDEAPHLAHFAIGVLRTPLNVD
jgi:hypothetical protein